LEISKKNNSQTNFSLLNRAFNYNIVVFKILNRKKYLEVSITFCPLIL